MPEKILDAARVERTDIGARPMILSGVAMLLGLAAMVGLAAWLYPDTLRRTATAPPLPAMAGPPLQPNTAADMARFRAAQLDALEAGGTHRPIDQSMHDIARTGIPDWPTTPYRAR